MSPRQAVEQALPEGARCANHPETAAALLCPRCGGFACQTCTRTDGEKPQCRDCFETYGPPVLDTMPASRGRRFANLLIDSLVGQALIWLPMFTSETALTDAMPSVLVGLTYYVALEHSLGLTLGKLITGTRVVDVSGRKASFGQVLARSVIRCIPFEPLSFLFGGPTGWHDTWSDTRVVDALGQVAPGHAADRRD